MKKLLTVLLCLLLALLLAATAWAWGRVLLPRQFGDHVRRSCEEFELPEAMVLAMCFLESRFDAEAVSSAGACGVMQLMPSTFSWIAGKLGEKQGDSAIFDPQTNIRYGCWYLSYLKKQFNGDRELMLAAYNAGPSTVTDWLRDERYSSDGRLKTIPYPETARYVNRCAKLQRLYGWLYRLDAEEPSR